MNQSVHGIEFGPCGRTTLVRWVFFGAILSAALLAALIIFMGLYGFLTKDFSFLQAFWLCFAALVLCLIVAFCICRFAPDE